MIRSAILSAGALLAATVPGLSQPGNAMSADAALAKFRADRPAMALALSEPIAACVVRHDTNNPAFHGCIDWHSAVHGTWALTAYTWATKDQRYRALIDSILKPSALARERARLDGDPAFEMPYGRAWFLRLAIDYRRMSGSDALDAFADDVAASLIAYYRRSPPDPRSYGYGNASWALINLYDYGMLRHDTAMVDFVRRAVRADYLTSGPCPLKRAEIDTREFMAVCTNWAWLVGKVLAPDAFRQWLAAFLPADLALHPVTAPASIHQTGLNFSRAWGVWNIYVDTGDPRFLSAYLDHFEETYSHPGLWKGNYYTVGHWVPQFGMLALMVTYDAWR